MRQIINPGDEELIALLVHVEAWKAMERKLEQMEMDTIEAFLQDPQSGPERAAEIELLRQIRRLPEECDSMKSNQFQKG